MNKIKVGKDRIQKETGNSVLFALSGAYQGWSVWVSRIECAELSDGVELSLVDTEYEIQKCASGNGMSIKDDCIFKTIPVSDVEQAFLTDKGE